MRANPRFTGLDKDFWAHVRSISQTAGYTVRASKKNGAPSAIKVHSVSEIISAFKRLGLDSDHLHTTGQPTDYGQKLLDYFKYRADVLNDTVQHQLMNAQQAEDMFKRLRGSLNHTLPLTINKQKGDKRKISFLTAMVNMLIEHHAAGQAFDYDPRELTTVTRNGRPLRTLSRRVDGAFPSAVNPVAVWEIKEYYYTTTFGSRVADGVYETLLDGMELEELLEHENIKVDHVLIVDAHYTWWDCGRAYLCRMIDMLNMGYVDEVLFGREIEERIPALVAEWLAKLPPQAQATLL